MTPAAAAVDPVALAVCVEGRGDQALFDAYLKAQQAVTTHREQCHKGCEIEPPNRCTRGFRLREAAGKAWDTFETTLPHPVFSYKRAPGSVRRQPPIRLDPESSPENAHAPTLSAEAAPCSERGPEAGESLGREPGALALRSMTSTDQNAERSGCEGS